MAIFGHSKFIQVFFGKMLEKNSKWPFLAIPNLYQSFCGNCWKNLELSFLAIPNLCQSFWENCQKKFKMAIFAHSKLIPVFLGKIVGRNLEWPLWPFPIYASLFGKIVRKNLEWPYLAIPNLYQSFLEKLSEKIYTSHLGKSV